MSGGTDCDVLRETELADCAGRVKERDGTAEGEGCGYEEGWDVGEAEGGHFYDTVLCKYNAVKTRFVFLQY